MPTRIPVTAWTILRTPIMAFSFSNIKEIAGSSGMDITQIAHLTQRGNPGATKGQLLDAMDGLINDMEVDQQHSYLSYFINEMLSRNTDLEESIQDLLQRIGWSVSEGEIFPIELQLDYELGVFDDGSRDLIKRAIQRYRDGDLSGTVTHICGILDRKTEKIFQDNNLDDHNGCSYHEKVSKSVRIKEEEFKASIRVGIDDESELTRIWRNHKKSLNCASLILASYRRNASDAHGQITSPTPQLVQDAINKALFILRSLS